MAVEQQSESQLSLNTVKLWTKRIKDAKKFFEPDFKRMRDNMEFAAGLQWPDQDKIQSNKYVANLVNREVNQKVASLYARDPKAVYRRRKRLDYQVWDGKVESLQAAYATVGQAQQVAAATMNPLMLQQPQVMQAQAVLNDFHNGQAWKNLIDKVGQTLEVLYGYQCDTQAPDFKYQMKQLVRRTVTCGVGYVRLNFSREGNAALTSSGTDDSLSMRIKRAKKILEGIDDDKITEDDPRRQQLEQLFASVESSMQGGDMGNVEERLEFDFPSSTSIIVDPMCKSLKGFIGAQWVAQQFIITLEDANAFFQKDIQATQELVMYSKDGLAVEKPHNSLNDSTKEKPMVCIWEVFDLSTKTHFFLCDGWRDYVQEPQPLNPGIHRFWPVFSLTFNDIEAEGGSKVHIYPPSDVDLLRDIQKEWNRTREELRKHRKSNRPFYLAVEGWLTDPDIEKLSDHETCEIIKVKGAPPNGQLRDAIVPFQSAPIDPTLYQTTPLMEDVTHVIGTNAPQAPMRHVAATPAVIQEQARISGVNSNVDDLDDLLSELARAAGEIMLKAFSLTTVRRVVGNGAVWPEQNREDFLNEVFLDIVAASSGRPNKAVEIANYERIAPLMLQAGANPWGIISEGIKRLDDRLEVLDFAPTQPVNPTPAAKPQGESPHGQPQQGGQPLQLNLGNQPVPLPGH